MQRAVYQLLASTALKSKRDGPKELHMLVKPCHVKHPWWEKKARAEEKTKVDKKGDR